MARLIKQSQISSQITPVPATPIKMTEHTDLDIHSNLFDELVVACKTPTCNSSSTIQELLKQCRPTEQYEVWCWLRKELINSSSKVTLQIHSSSDSNNTKEFNIVDISNYVEASPQNYGRGTYLVMRMDNCMLAAMKDTSNNTGDEHPSDSYTRNFVQHMLKEEVGLLTETFCKEHQWEYPIKLYVDALLIDSFVRAMNHEFDGLTKHQQSLLQSVLDEFNNNALTHSPGDHFLLQANPEFIIC